MWTLIKKFFSTYLSFVCTLITLAQFFLRTSSYQELAQKYTWLKLDEISLKSAVIIALILGVIIFAFEIYSYNKKSKHSKEAAISFHRFNHKIRDYIFSIEDPRYSKKYNNHRTFYNQVGNDCEELCEQIANFVKERTGKEFSVCIKLLHSATASSVNGKINSKTYTLCRSGKNKAGRKESGVAMQYNAVNEYEILTPISENTAFKYIIDNEYNDKGRPSIFACSNLIMYKILNFLLNGEQYQNPNKCFWKHYLSTIVVPIRIKPKIIEYDFEEVGLNGYLTLGFLCIDYRWPISKALKNELSGYANGFSDALFNLLYETYKCDKKITEQEKSTIQ